MRGFLWPDGTIFGAIDGCAMCIILRCLAVVVCVLQCPNSNADDGALTEAIERREELLSFLDAAEGDQQRLIELLRNGLHDTHHIVRNAAVSRVTGLGAADAVLAVDLVEILAVDQVCAREKLDGACLQSEGGAAYALAAIGPAALPALKDGLKSRNVEIVFGSCIAIREMSAPADDVFDSLWPLLEHRNSRVRLFAVEALSSLTGLRTLEVGEIMSEWMEEQDAGVRYRLLLLAASVGVDDVERRTIVAGQIGKQVFESDVAGTAIAKRESVDRLIADILATLQLNRRYTLFTGKRAMPVTVDSATCLYTVLGMCGASAQVALPLLRRSIRDPEALSGEEAVRTYVSIQMEVDRQRVFELIGELLGERDASLILRGLAMAAEVPDVDPNVLNRISALTRHSDPQVREAAIRLEARD